MKNKREELVSVPDGSLVLRGAELTQYGDEGLRLLTQIAAALEQRLPVDVADEVYTAQEAAAFLRCSVSTLRRLVPPSFRLGRSPRWRRSALLSL